MTNLEREQAARSQMRRRGGDQFANQFVARRSAKECDGRIVSHFRARAAPLRSVAT